MTRREARNENGFMIYILDDVLRPIAALTASDGDECTRICDIMKHDYKIESVETVDAAHLDMINQFEDHIHGL